jgi:hypothetical protein
MNDLATAVSTLDKIDSESLHTWEEFVSCGLIAREFKDVSQWVLGKLALGIEKDYGTDALGKYAVAIGVNFKTLQRYRWVVRHFPEVKISEPKPLPFYVYETVANTSDPQKWISRAIENDWSPPTMVKMVRAYRKGVPVEELSYLTCPACGHKFHP